MAYVATKRRNGEWGDDPEIQAICEIYSRPASIYVYDVEKGAKQLRTFHGGTHTNAVEPLRLS